MLLSPLYTANPPTPRQRLAYCFTKTTQGRMHKHTHTQTRTDTHNHLKHTHTYSNTHTHTHTYAFYQKGNTRCMAQLKSWSQYGHWRENIFYSYSRSIKTCNRSPTAENVCVWATTFLSLFKEHHTLLNTPEAADSPTLRESLKICPSRCHLGPPTSETEKLVCKVIRFILQLARTLTALNLWLHSIVLRIQNKWPPVQKSAKDRSSK